VRFGGRRLVGILPHDSVNNSSVSDFQTVSVIGNCCRHLLRASGNSDKCRGVIEKSEVLKRPVDGAHLSVCEVDLRLDGFGRFATKILRKHTAERIKPFCEAIADLKSKTEISSLSRSGVCFRRVKQ